jgi:hypothetical protein
MRQFSTASPITHAHRDLRQPVELLKNLSKIAGNIIGAAPMRALPNWMQRSLRHHIGPIRSWPVQHIRDGRQEYTSGYMILRRE